MMWSICVVTFFLGYPTHGAFLKATDDDQPSLINRISGIIEKKCIQNADLDQYNQVTSELNNLQNHCLKQIDPPEGAVDEVFTKRCYARTDQVIQCLNRFGEKLKPCLDDDEKYMSQIFPEEYRHFANYYCQHVTDVTTMMRTSNIDMDCVENLKHIPAINPETVCLKYVSDLKSYGSITKAALCSVQMRIQQCYNDIVSIHCPNATQLQHLMRNYWKAIVAPCNDIQVPTKPSGNVTE